MTRCGTYAWQNTSFDLEQNIIVAPNMYKGRPVNDTNIQVDCKLNFISDFRVS